MRDLISVCIAAWANKTLPSLLGCNNYRTDFLVFAPFHGDARWGKFDLSSVGVNNLLSAGHIYQETLEKITLRAAELKDGLDYLLQHPDYRDRINLNQIAAIGTCFGAPPLLALSGARLGADIFGSRLLDIPKDSRFKSIVSLVPFSGTRVGALQVPNYGGQQQGMRGVDISQFAIVGSVDTVSPPALTATALAQSSSWYYTVSLEGFDHKNWIKPAADELSLWVDTYLRSSLRGDLGAYDRLQTMSSIGGGVDDRLVSFRESSTLPRAMSDKLFDLAEASYPTLFPDHPQSGALSGYYARCYVSRALCLGTQNDQVYVYDGQQLLALGHLREWLIAMRVAP